MMMIRRFIIVLSISVFLCPSLVFSAASSQVDSNKKSQTAPVQEKNAESAVAPSASAVKTKPESALAQSTAKRLSSNDLPIQDVFAAKGPQVEVVADNLEYSKEQKKIIAKGNVVITYEGTKLTSDYAEVETETKNAFAKGHVLVFQGNGLSAEGEEVHYYFASNSGNFPNGTAYSFPWSITGKEINQLRQNVLEIKNARITSCDKEEPHYEIRASKALLYRGDKVVAWNTRIYMLGKPIFWWPYFVIPLEWLELPFGASVGNNSEDGAYIYTYKGVALTEHIAGKILVDWRSRRGVGGGGLFDYNYGPMCKGNFVGYVTQDKRAPTVSESNPFSVREDRTRGRLTWRHRTNFDPYTHLLLRLHKASDEYVLQDFFKKEYYSEIEQQSFVTFTKNSERFGTMLHVEKRMNDYEAMVERLPEIRVDWKNQPFFKPWLFYEDQTSFANLNTRFGRSDMRQHVVRGDTFHEWSVPLRWQDIKFTPFANMRYTEYSRQFDSSSSAFRTALGYGADTRTQFYKTFPVSFDKLGIEINHLRHILEPSVALNSIHPSTVSDEKLSHFDTIDRVDDQDIITFGIENRLQTKRVVNGRMQRVDVVSLNTFLNYEVHPDEPTTKSSFKVLDQEVVLRPYDWLQYQTRCGFDTERGQWRTFNQDLIIRKWRLQFLFGHRYVKNPSFYNADGEIDESQQFVFESSFKVNPLWELHGYIRWDPDHKDVSEWQVGAQRDLHDFLLDFGYNVRNSAIRSHNSELYFNLTMKQFPRFPLRSGGGRATFSTPRIGETVAGANQYGAYDPNQPFEQSNL